MKTITKIVAQQKSKSRCNIFLDDEFFCGMEVVTVMKYRLKVGDKVTEKQLNEIVFSSELETAMQKTFGYLSRGMRTEARLRKYLADKGFLPEIIDQVVAKMRYHDWLDDNKYCLQYVEVKSKTKGKKMLAYELRQQGVAQNIIDQVLEDAPDEFPTVLALCQKFFADGNFSYQNIARCYRRLLAKGFSQETIKRAIDKVKNMYEYCQT